MEVIDLIFKCEKTKGGTEFFFELTESSYDSATMGSVKNYSRFLILQTHLSGSPGLFDQEVWDWTSCSMVYVSSRAHAPEPEYRTCDT